jgi:predicted AAA+ superfamily ATPase
MLSIQKVIVLLDDFHYEALCEHFKTIKAELPLRLIQESRNMGITEKDSDELCKLIYEKAGALEKRKFFQLAHHTFKLTAFLAEIIHHTSTALLVE